MKRKIKLMCPLFFLLFSSAEAIAQQSNQPACALSSYANGGTVTLKGTVVDGPHDMLLSISGCPDAVVLAYGEASEQSPNLKEHGNANLKRFQKYTSAVYQGTKNHPCGSCPMYQVQATLTGKLEVATIPAGTTKDSLGLLHDASGKIVGKWGGWGHPLPFAGYRLVIFSVAYVNAQKLPNPTVPRSAMP
jgi:hypothetical protein